MAEPLLVRVACPDRDSATAIARAAVGQRLAACANLSDITSVYRWEGDVAEDTEVIVLFKTDTACRAALVACIVEQHPYELPAITWHAVGATPETADWIAAETGKS